MKRQILLCASLAVSLNAGAAEYPARPIRLVVPFGPGSITDLLARTVSMRLPDALGQQVVVDNRPGAGGLIGSDLVAKAFRDGYTIMLGGASTYSINRSLYSSMPYDSATAFAPITQMSINANVLVVNPSFPVKSVQELIAYGKANPGKLNYASTGAGGSIHLSAEMFKAMAGINMVHATSPGGPTSAIVSSSTKTSAESAARVLASTHLADLGVLGPSFTAAHGVWLDEDDMKRLADAGASISHNPASNMRYGNGLAAVRRMLDFGVNVGLGTDSRSCSDNLNMFEAMRLASFASRVQTPDYKRWLTTDEVLRMATTNSARLLGFGDDLGAIARGYKADIVFLDLKNLNYVPLNSAINQVVNAEEGTGVGSVMIGGRIVFENGRVTTVDLDRLRAGAAATMERLRSATRNEWALAMRLEDVVGSFCVGLAQSPYHVHRYCGHA